MQVDLSGLRALVTGSTKGIGRAIAQRARSQRRRGGHQWPQGSGYRASDRELHAAPRCRKGASRPAPGDAGTRRGRCEHHRGRRRRRHPGQQCGRVRDQGRLRDSGRGLAAAVRHQCTLRRPLHPALRAAHARQRLRAHHLHLVGIRRANSDRDDPLRLHQSGRSRADARLCPGAGREPA